MKIAVFCPNWVGDLVMATPALRSLRLRYPQAEIVGVMRPYLRSVLEGTELLDWIIPLEHGKSNTFQKRLETVQALRREAFDLAVLLPNSLRSAWWAWLSGARERIGFSRNGRSFLLTQGIAGRNRSTPHPVLNEYLRLVEAAGCTELPTRTELAVSESDRAQLKRFWQKHPEANSADVICFNPGGAFGGSKHWPSSHFSRLGKMVVEEFGSTVLVLCGPSERGIAREIVALGNDSRILSLGDEDLSLGLTKAAVERARVLVTTDSGPRHFAPPLGVPSIVLYGPTHQEWSSTPAEEGRGLQLKLDCGPCQQRSCPLGHHRCMQELSPDMVFERLRSLISAPCKSTFAA